MPIINGAKHILLQCIDGEEGKQQQEEDGGGAERGVVGTTEKGSNRWEITRVKINGHRIGFKIKVYPYHRFNFLDPKYSSLE